MTAAFRCRACDQPPVLSERWTSPGAPYVETPIGDAAVLYVRSDVPDWAREHAVQGL